MGLSLVKEEGVLGFAIASDAGNAFCAMEKESNLEALKKVCDGAAKVYSFDVK